MLSRNPFELPVFVARFSDFPVGVRKANLFLWTSWTFHCLFVYFLFIRQAEQFPTKILLQQIAIGAILCVFFLQVKRWARILSILFNLAAAVMYLLVSFLLYRSSPPLTFFSIFNLCLFAVSIYYLLMKETSDFFRPERAGDEGRNGGNSAPMKG